MPTMRLRVSSLLRILCFTAAICCGRGFLARPLEIPQTQQQMQARDFLNQGVEAFKNGQADEAVRLFERAKEMDPNLINARLYLATALASQYIPGAPSEENKRFGERAVAEFRSVLLTDGQNLTAIDGIGALLFQMAGNPFDAEAMEESKSFHQKHTQISQQDPEPYYWIGVIDWTLAFRAENEMRRKFNESSPGRDLPPAEPLPPGLRAEYAQKYGTMIEEGIDNLKRAIFLRPDYDDAMAYLNLMYRCKANAAEMTAQREELTKMADELIEKVKEIKQKRAMSQPNQP
jgi:tetratricopeptide (TPR) repeat protein